MCGIVGYIGKEEAAPIILDALSKLEYRGYDSAGVAVRDQNNEVHVVKEKGRLKLLSDKIDGGKALHGTIGIGHTRWATHGEPSIDNAHPHISDDGNITGVHNGIIENYKELKDKLERKGYVFHSETDTEIAIKLVDYYYKKYQVGPIDALAKAMVRMRGSYALAILLKDYPDQIWVARKDSPLILGKSEEASYIASDVPAILKYTRNVYYLDNLEIACLKRNEITFYNLDGDEIQKEAKYITWNAEAAEKGGFEHFMAKEIHEQPRVIKDTLSSMICDGKLDLSSLSLDFKKITHITIIACGSAWHVGMNASYVIEDLASVPVRVELASEYRYRKQIKQEGELVIIISQSGETADSLAALRLAKASGIQTLGIVNVVGSSIAREAGHVLYTLAGPEISVATTKAYSAQLVALYAIALSLGHAKGTISEDKMKYYLDELQTLPTHMEDILKDAGRIQYLASKFSSLKDIFLIGRGIDYTIALEGSLKCKEISYIHSEAYAAGELKHGTISLIEPGTLVVGILTQEGVYEKTLSNLVECKSRGAVLLGITSNGHYNLEDTANYTLYVPKIDAHFIGSLAVIPLQLLGYYLSVSKGLDVDKPRNLAKSVTVE